jgi:hypothetical protein
LTVYIAWLQPSIMMVIELAKKGILPNTQILDARKFSLGYVAKEEVINVFSSLASAGMGLQFLVGGGHRNLT